MTYGINKCPIVLKKKCQRITKKIQFKIYSESMKL